MDWAHAQRRAILFLLGIAVVAGGLTSVQMPVALFPSVSFPRIAIAIDAGDQPAAQMINLVTRPVEEAVKAVPGLKEVRSTTSRGSAELSLNFAWGSDMNVATLQVQAELDRVLPTLPAGTSFEVRRMSPFVFPIAAYSLTSDSLDVTRLTEIARYELMPLLSSIDGVAKIEVLGGALPEIRVEGDPVQLESHGLAMTDLQKALSSNSILSAVGKIEDRHKLFLTIADNRLTRLDDVRAIVVKATPRGAIRLGEVARVYAAAQPMWTRVSADGHSAVILQVKQQPDGNTVQIVRDVQRALHDRQPHLPPGLHISNWYDQSELISGSARSVLEAVMIGVLLAGLVLFLFLRNLRITLITLIVVPAVLLSTVLLLSIMGASFNIMTLGGMAAAIGLIIDDAIVMIEQMERGAHSSNGSAAIRMRDAAHAFITPLAGSSAATTVIFVPLAFLSGVTGAFFKALSLTLACSLIISFVAAALVVPILAAHLLKGGKAPEHASPNRFTQGLIARYRSSLDSVVRQPIYLVPVAIALVLVGYLSWRAVGSGFMPVMDEGGFVLDYIAPPGTALSDTDAMLQSVEAVLRSTPEVQTYSRRTGLQLGGGLTESNMGDIFVRLKADRSRGIEDIMSDVRTRVQKDVPGLEVETAQLMEDLIGDLTAVPQPIEIKLFGDDPGQLVELAPRVAKAIAAVPGVTEIRSGVVLAGDGVVAHVDPIRAGAEGLDAGEVAAQIKAYLSGNVVTQFQQRDHSIDVRVWRKNPAKTRLVELRGMRLLAPGGHYLSLNRVADLRIESGQPQVTRDNLKPMVAVTARIAGRDLGGTVADLKTFLDKSSLMPRGTYYVLGGLYEQQRIAFRGLLGVLASAVALVFLLLLLLYREFRAAIAVILMPLLAMPAVFTGLWITGVDLNISAMMGMTMVVGIVTEIAIFWFSEYQQLVKDGLPPHDALLQAGLNRFRPIVMTTIAAILALFPLALALGEGASMQQPLAIAIISGLIVQIPLVLWLMPAVYHALTRDSPRGT